MEELHRGDVVFAQFIFTDASQTKRRPAVIVAVLPQDNYILCPVTSRARREDPYRISLGSDELIGEPLPLDSYIRPNLLMTVHRSLILWKQGELPADKMQKVVDVIVGVVTGLM